MGEIKMKKMVVKFIAILISIGIFFPVFGEYIPRVMTEDEQIAEIFWRKFREYSRMVWPESSDEVAFMYLHSKSVCVRNDDYKQTFAQEKALYIDSLNKAAKEIYGTSDIKQDGQGALSYNGDVSAIKARVNEFNFVLADFENIEQVRDKNEKQLRDDIKYVKNFDCAPKKKFDDCEKKLEMKRDALSKGENFNCGTVFQYGYARECFEDASKCWFNNIRTMSE